MSDICTRSCLVDQGNCSDLSAQARCTNQSVEPGAVAVCDLACSNDDSCVALGGGFACQGGFCRSSAKAESSASQGGSASTVNDGGPLLAAGATNDTPEGGSAPAPDVAGTGGDGTAPADCPAIDGGTVPEPTAGQCAGEVATCSPLGQSGCSSSPWSVTLGAIAKDCGAYCGRLTVAVKAGCVTAVQFLQFSVTAPQSDTEAKSCVLTRVLGQNWDCQPSAGWLEVYLGSCTIQ